MHIEFTKWLLETKALHRGITFCVVLLGVCTSFLGCTDSGTDQGSDPQSDSDGDEIIDRNDCAPLDPTRYQRLIYTHRDADGDSFTISAPGEICSGNDLPQGYLNRANGEDCDDGSAELYVLLRYGFRDADGDTYTIESAGLACSGSVLPTGYLREANGNDCNDADRTVWQLLDGYVEDPDGDGYGSGPQMQYCSGEELPEGVLAESDYFPHDSARWGHSEPIILSDLVDSADSYADVSGNLYNISRGILYKYDPTGALLWSTPVVGWRGKMALSPAGDIYILGQFSGTVDFDPTEAVDNHSADNTHDDTFETYLDLFVTKFSSEGEYLWTQTIGGPDDERAREIHVLPRNKVVISGHTRNDHGFSWHDHRWPPFKIADHTTRLNREETGRGLGLVVTLNADGTYDSWNTIGSPSEYGLQIVSISPTSFQAQPASSSFFVQYKTETGCKTKRKLKAGWNGGVIMDDIFFPPPIMTDTQPCVQTTDRKPYARPVVASDDQVYLAGSFTDSLDGDNAIGGRDVYIRKLSPLLETVWTYTFGGLGDEEVWGSAVDAQNNLYVIGQYTGTVDFDPNGQGYESTASNDRKDPFILKLNADGTFSWLVTLEGPSRDGRLYSIIALNNGRMGIIGYGHGGVDLNFPGGVVDAIVDSQRFFLEL